MQTDQFRKTSTETRSIDYQGNFITYYSQKDSLVQIVDDSLCNLLGFQQIIEILNLLFLSTYDCSIGTADMLVLKSAWQNKTYSEIASEENYSSNYLSNVVAPKLFAKISELIDCRVTKKNCQSLLTKYIRQNLKIADNEIG